MKNQDQEVFNEFCWQWWMPFVPELNHIPDVGKMVESSKSVVEKIKNLINKMKLWKKNIK